MHPAVRSAFPSCWAAPFEAGVSGRSLCGRRAYEVRWCKCRAPRPAADPVVAITCILHTCVAAPEDRGSSAFGFTEVLNEGADFDDGQRLRYPERFIIVCSPCLPHHPYLAHASVLAHCRRLIGQHVHSLQPIPVFLKHLQNTPLCLALKGRLQGCFTEDNGAEDGGSGGPRVGAAAEAAEELASGVGLQRSLAGVLDKVRNQQTQLESHRATIILFWPTEY